MKLNQKPFGYLLIGFAVILLISLTLVKLNFDNQAVLLCQAVNDNPDLSMSECPAHKSNVPWLIIISFGISFLILISGLYVLYTKSDDKELKQDFKEVDLTKLNDEEIQIYNLLKEKGGSMYQSDLIKETGLGKVRITRVLDKLEHDDHILERKRRGMTNIIVLK